ncbi:hypothetical protein K4K52_009454 [Colletotrichum sp. SAR 10_76]|nr:hypothetical protein K4K52_009454 [Colletotrichum sp. SAR 10_76]
MSTKTLESKKSDLAFLNEKITAFQNDLASSTIDTATGDDDLFHRLAVDARKYEREIASMTCRRNELTGKIMDTRVFKDVLADVQTEDWDWDLLVVDNIELPAEATVGFEFSRAEDFRARVMDAHGQDESDHACDFRPDKKYLYFRLLTTLLQRQRLKVPDAVFDRAKLDQAARALWGGPGLYLKASALHKMSCQVGNLTEAAAMQLWGLERPPAELDEE